jgi:hypothetical protein
MEQFWSLHFVYYEIHTCPLVCKRNTLSLKLKVTFLYDNSDLKQKITHIKLDDDDKERHYYYYSNQDLKHDTALV